jgi:murein DD-endopeptidase MepM/ murein hydrolase activator NlpD
MVYWKVLLVKMYIFSLRTLLKSKIFRRILTGILLYVFFLSSACNSGRTNGEDWVYPFPLDRHNGCYKVATPFSVENPWDHAHEAVDFACLADTPVLAVQSGVVEEITFAEVLGEKRGRISLSLNDVLIRVEYLNLKQVEVQEGQTVSKGERLGLSATGLHLAVWDGTQGIYVDPAGYLILPVPEGNLE